MFRDISRKSYNIREDCACANDFLSWMKSLNWTYYSLGLKKPRVFFIITESNLVACVSEL